MIVPRYAAGDWFAVVTDGAVALLPPSVDDAKVAEVWDALRESPDLTHGLAVLARGGLVGLPPFALVSVVDGHVRGFLRGDVRLLVTTSERLGEHTATHVATWAEINVPDADALTVAVPEDEAPRGRTARMPALAAVVLASSVEVVLRAGASAVPALPSRSDLEVRSRPDARGTRASADDLPAGPAPRRALEPSVAPPAAEMTVAPVAEPSEPAAATAAVATAAAPAPTGPGPAPASGAPEAIGQQMDGLGGVPVHALETVPATSVTLLQEAASDPDDDVHGSTVLTSSLVELRRQMPDWQQDFVPGPFSVPGVPVRVHRIRMASGLVVPLDRAVLIGRAPVVSRVSARDLPRLVTVASPNQDISRTHAQVRAEGEDVLVTDLNSTNGMLLVEPGQPARRLRPGEATVVVPGAVVDLGDGVTFELERDE